jgi:phospholipase/carboxylesterase
MLDYDYIAAPQPPADASKRYHCLILHGLGDSKHGWKDVTRMLALKELSYLFAQAPIPYFGGWSWFNMGNDLSLDLDSVRDSRKKLRELVEHLLDKLGIGSERLFLLGFSQGSLMTIDFGVREASRFAGLIGISGFFTFLDEYPAAFSPVATKQDILITHGVDDDLVPIGFPKQQIAILRKAGLTIDWREYAKAHGVDPAEELPEIRQWIHQRMK